VASAGALVVYAVSIVVYPPNAIACLVHRIVRLKHGRRERPGWALGEAVCASVESGRLQRSCAGTAATSMNSRLIVGQCNPTCCSTAATAAPASAAAVPSSKSRPVVANTSSGPTHIDSVRPASRTPGRADVCAYVSNRTDARFDSRYLCSTKGAMRVRLGIVRAKRTSEGQAPPGIQGDRRSPRTAIARGDLRENRTRNRRRRRHAWPIDIQL